MSHNTRVVYGLSATLLSAFLLLSGCGKTASLRGESPAPQGVGAPPNASSSPTTGVPNSGTETQSGDVQEGTGGSTGVKTTPPVSKNSSTQTSKQVDGKPVVVQKQTSHCYDSANYVFPLDSRYHVVQEGGYFTAYVSSVGPVFANYTNLYAAFGSWAGMRFNGGYIENGRYVASEYVFHIMRSEIGLVGVVSRDDGTDRIIGAVENIPLNAKDQTGNTSLQKVMIRLNPEVCLVQYGDSAGNLVSAGAGWLLLQ